MGGVPPFLTGAPAAADVETVLAVRRSTKMANGATQLPHRLQDTDTAQHLVTWIVGTKGKELGTAPRTTA
jgi:hypothetical protein